MTGFLVANCFQGVFPGPPVFFRAVVFDLAISLKYNESLGSACFPDIAAINRDKSFPLVVAEPFEGGSTFPFLTGDGSGVLCTLVSGVELNSEQTIESESLQPVLSSTGAVKI